MFKKVFSVFLIQLLSNAPVSMALYTSCFIGNHVHLHWTLSHTPCCNKDVYVRNPNGMNMFWAQSSSHGTYGLYVGRVTYSGDAWNRDISFTLYNVNTSDAGTYQAYYDYGYGYGLYYGVTLVIYVRPDTPSITYNSSVQLVGSNLELRCYSHSNSVPSGYLTMSYHWYLNGGTLYGSSHYNITGRELIIHNIRESDKGSRFQCRAWETTSLMSSTSSAITVDPEYGPSVVTVTPRTTYYSLVIGNRLGPVTCAADCEPDCSFRWLRGSTTAVYGSVLNINNIRKEQHGTYTCTASNTHGSRSSTSISVTVKFGPLSIALHPTETLYRIVQGSSLGPITCSADCNPSCTFAWSHDGYDLGSTSNVLNIYNIDRGQAGTYRCKATNTYGTRQVGVTVLVEFAPVNVTVEPVMTVYRPLQGTTFGPIVCHAECEPACVFRWSYYGKTIRQASETLTITNIQRGERGTYTCSATNTHGSSIHHITVEVEFSPINLQLNPSTTFYTPEQGTRLGPITCIADCEPTCSYQWSRNSNNIVINSKVLDLINIQHGNSGTYTCVATNRHGARRGTVTVTVKFSPIITKFNVRPNGPDIEENTTVSVVCEVTGYPMPTVSIGFDRNATIIEQENNPTTILFLGNIDCLQTGNYHCNAANEMGNATKEAVINVLCAPRPDHRVSISLQHGIGNEDNMNITGTFIANPPPVLTWKFRTTETQKMKRLDNDTSSFYCVNEDKDNITYSSRAIENDLNEDNFGLYILEASNIMGTSRLVYRVFPSRKPDPPVPVLGVCTATDKAEIMWIPKFDGGDQQSFKIGFRKDRAHHYHHSEYVSGNIQEGHFMRGSVSGLDPGTTYFYTVFAINKFGNSSSKSELNCTTYGNQKESSEHGLLFNLGSGMLAFGVLFVIVATLVCFICRRKVRNERRSIDGIKGSNNGAGRKPRLSYENLTEREITQPNIYSTVGQSNVKDKEHLYVNTTTI